MTEKKRRERASVSTTGMRPSAQRTVGRRHRSAFKVTKRSDIATTTQGAKKKYPFFCERCFTDPQTGVASGVTQSRNVRSRYRCSMCPAIHINSRSWLRSSSTHEPSDPPPRVVFFTSLWPSRVAGNRNDGQALIGNAVTSKTEELRLYVFRVRKKKHHTWKAEKKRNNTIRGAIKAGQPALNTPESASLLLPLPEGLFVALGSPTRRPVRVESRPDKSSALPKVERVDPSPFGT